MEADLRQCSLVWMIPALRWAELWGTSALRFDGVMLTIAMSSADGLGRGPKAGDVRRVMVLLIINLFLRIVEGGDLHCLDILLNL